MHRATHQIRFHFLVKPFFFPDRTRLKKFLVKRFKIEGRKVESINYIFCSDSYLYQINKQYLGHNSLTDIITFELNEPGQPVVADVFISTERIKENATLFATSFKQELHRVIFHGALHLVGYNDKSKKEVQCMRQKEQEYLAAFLNVPRGKY